MVSRGFGRDSGTRGFGLGSVIRGHVRGRGAGHQLILGNNVLDKIYYEGIIEDLISRYTRWMVPRGRK